MLVSLLYQGGPSTGKISQCSAQTRTGIGHLRKPPGVELIPCRRNHLGVRAPYATRRKLRYEANKCG